MGTDTRVSKIIYAPPERLYQAFLDPALLATWRVPDNMTARVNSFEPREGGKYCITLTYRSGEESAYGKSTPGTDTFRGVFVRLVPNEEIIEKIEFESSDAKYIGEMTMTTTLTKVAGGCEVTVLCEDLPRGIRPEDNEEGCRMALKNLARLVE
jgi:uncharacterized protein YndB with AHSA1/START domain